MILKLFRNKEKVSSFSAFEVLMLYDRQQQSYLFLHTLSQRDFLPIIFSPDQPNQSLQDFFVQGLKTKMQVIQIS
jgi:hypothetical protein